MTTKQAKTKQPREGLARVKEACQFLAIGRTKLYQLVKKNILKPVPIPESRLTRFSWEDLERLAAERRKLTQGGAAR